MDARLSPVAVEHIVDKAIRQVRGAALLAVKQWRCDLESLLAGLESVTSVPDLMAQLHHRRVDATDGRPWLNPGDRVKVHWAANDTWHAGIVSSVRTDGQIDVVFEDCEYSGLWGIFHEKHVRKA